MVVLIEILYLELIKYELKIARNSCDDQNKREIEKQRAKY